MPLMQSPPGARTVIDGRRYVYFAGTGYLGLQGHAEVIRAACDATKQYGIGSATSRSGFGNVPPTLDVERRAAEFFAVDDSFYFTSGYVGNHILASMLEGTFDAVFVDELSHYCVFEAARLSARHVYSFRHCDVDDLRTTLRANLPPGRQPLVMTDGVFAARGSIAPLAKYRDVLAEYPGAMMCVDDAHALGVLGENGRGSYEYAGLFDAGVNAHVEPRPEPSFFLCATLSKAIGGFGGIIPGSHEFIDRLKATSPYFGGASAPPAPAAAASAKALELVIAEPATRTRLRENVALLKQGLRKMGLAVDDTPAPIVCLTLGSAGNMQRIQRELMQRGICIACFAAYSGLGSEGALRIAVFATHTEQMIDELLHHLSLVLQES